MDTSQNPPGISCLVHSGQVAKQHESIHYELKQLSSQPASQTDRQDRETTLFTNSGSKHKQVYYTHNLSTKWPLPDITNHIMTRLNIVASNSQSQNSDDLQWVLQQATEKRLVRGNYAQADEDCLPHEPQPMSLSPQQPEASVQHPLMTTFHQANVHRLLTDDRFHAVGHLYKSAPLVSFLLVKITP